MNKWVPIELLVGDKMNSSLVHYWEMTALYTWLSSQIYIVIKIIGETVNII